MSDEEISRLWSAEDPASRVRLADLLVASGRPEEAVTVCRAALVRKADEAALHLALGRALSATGELDEAQAVFRVAKALRDAAPREAGAESSGPRSGPTSGPQAVPRREISGPTGVPRTSPVPPPPAAPIPAPRSSREISAPRAAPTGPPSPAPTPSARSSREVSGPRTSPVPPAASSGPVARPASRDPGFPGVPRSSPVPAAPSSPIPTARPGGSTSGPTRAIAPSLSAPAQTDGDPDDDDVTGEGPRRRSLPSVPAVAPRSVPPARAPAQEEVEDDPTTGVGSPSRRRSPSRPVTFGIQSEISAETPLPPPVGWDELVEDSAVGRGDGAAANRAPARAVAAAPGRISASPHSLTPLPSRLGDDDLLDEAVTEFPLPPELPPPPSVPAVERSDPDPISVDLGDAPGIAGTRLDLDAIAEGLLERGELLAAAEPDSDGDREIGRRFAEARRGALTRLWTWLFALIGVTGVGAGWRWHYERGRFDEAVVAWQGLSADATLAGDLAARDAIAQAARSHFHSGIELGRAALASARLFADDGMGTDGAALSYLRRAARESNAQNPAAVPGAPPPPAGVDVIGEAGEDARALLALGRGEPCPGPTHAPEVSARCALRAGDSAAARAALDHALVPGSPSEKDLRALLLRADLAAAAGEVPRAAADDQQVLVLHPGHPRALAGLALLGAAGGTGKSERPPLAELPPPGIGASAEGWWRLALSAQARARGDGAAEGKLLDLVEAGANRDGLLAARLGLARFDQGRIADAARWLRVAARTGPGDPAVEILDAELATGRGLSVEVAKKLAGRAGPPRLLVARGRAELSAGHAKEALATLDAALLPLGAGSEIALGTTAATWRALARARLGNRDAALRELGDLAAAHPLPTTPRYGLGVLAFERGDLSRARAELSLATVGQPDAVAAIVLLGEVDRRLGRTADAVAELESVSKGEDVLPSAASSLGRLYHSIGRDREAKRLLLKVIEAGRATVEDRLALAEATIAEGTVAEADRRLAELKAEKGTPAPGADRLLRDRLLLDSRRGGKPAQDAAKAFEKLLKREPRDAELMLATALSEQRGGDRTRALALFRGVTSAMPLRANLLLGDALLAGGDARGAESAFRTALDAWSQGPNGPPARAAAQLGLGRALLAARDNGAVAALELACERDPQSAEARYSLARAALAQGDPERARDEAARATLLDERHADAFRLFAELSEKSDPEDARRAYHRFLEISPGDAAVAEVRRRLANLDGGDHK